MFQSVCFFSFRLFACSFVRLFVYSFIRSSDDSFIRSFVRSFVRPLTHSLAPLSPASTFRFWIIFARFHCTRQAKVSQCAIDVEEARQQQPVSLLHTTHSATNESIELRSECKVGATLASSSQQPEAAASRLRGARLATGARARVPCSLCRSRAPSR